MLAVARMAQGFVSVRGPYWSIQYGLQLAVSEYVRVQRCRGLVEKCSYVWLSRANETITTSDLSHWNTGIYVSGLISRNFVRFVLQSRYMLCLSREDGTTPKQLISNTRFLRKDGLIFVTVHPVIEYVAQKAAFSRQEHRWVSSAIPKRITWLIHFFSSGYLILTYEAVSQL